MIVSCRFSKDSPYTFSTQFLQPVNIQGASKLKRIHYFFILVDEYESYKKSNCQRKNKIGQRICMIILYPMIFDHHILLNFSNKYSIVSRSLNDILLLVWKNFKISSLKRPFNLSVLRKKRRFRNANSNQSKIYQW